jgi:hypothetical protein
LIIFTEEDLPPNFGDDDELEVEEESEFFHFRVRALDGI